MRNLAPIAASLVIATALAWPSYGQDAAIPLRISPGCGGARAFPSTNRQAGRGR